MTSPEHIDLSHAVEGLLVDHHKGRDNGLTCRQLAARFVCVERDIRKAVEHLRMLGKPVGGHPSHGYYWCISEADFAVTAEYLTHRALKSLKQLACMRQTTIPELLGQLQLQLTEPTTP